MRWLMLRGLVREARHWGDFPAVFEQVTGQKPVLVDLPGVGTESGRPVPMSISGMVDDIRGRFFRKTRGEGPFGLIAVSLGGMIALDWLSRHPHDFEAGVVINTSVGDLSRPWERLRYEQYGRLARFLFVNQLQREQFILAMTAHSPALNAPELAKQWAKYAEDAPVATTAALSQLIAAMRSTLPKKLHVPTLVMTSRGDRLVSHRCSERIAEKLNLPIVHHDRGGHDLPLDDPHWVTEQITKWLATTREQPASARTSRPPPRAG